MKRKEAILYYIVNPLWLYLTNEIGFLEARKLFTKDKEDTLVTKDVNLLIPALTTLFQNPILYEDFMYLYRDKFTHEDENLLEKRIELFQEIFEVRQGDRDKELHIKGDIDQYMLLSQKLIRILSDIRHKICQECDCPAELVLEEETEEETEETT